MPDQHPIPAIATTDPALAQLHLPLVIDCLRDAEVLALWRLVCAWVEPAPRQPRAEEEYA